MDALLLLSFGGPEGPDDVMPFLRRVTAGRGVPEERLSAVAEHYQHFGGISPINALNRALIGGIEECLAKADIALPVYFGNRNWHPLVEDTLATMADDGIRRALVFPTSAYGGYSACRQYDEDITRARVAVGERAPELVKIRQYFDHPLFIGAFADAVRRAVHELPAACRDDHRLVFSAHSIPVAADIAAGPAADGGHWYSRQVVEAARLVAVELGLAPGEYDVVWQSRSGPPGVPWLEPDIVDHVADSAARGVTGMVVCPIGFVSDHLEVVWDLDTEAREAAAAHGLALARASTPGADSRFADMIVELITEHLDAAPVRKLSTFPIAGQTVNGASCFTACCESPRRR